MILRLFSLFYDMKQCEICVNFLFMRECMIDKEGVKRIESIVVFAEISGSLFFAPLHNVCASSNKFVQISASDNRSEKT